MGKIWFTRQGNAIWVLHLARLSSEDGQDLVHKAGQCHLGAAVGSTKFIVAYLNGKVASWVAQVDCLAAIAATQLHAAYATFIFGLQYRWIFLQHTMRTASEHMQPLKDAICGKLIPMLIKHELNDVKLELVTVACMLWWHVFE